MRHTQAEHGGHLEVKRQWFPCKNPSTCGQTLLASGTFSFIPQEFLPSDLKWNAVLVHIRWICEYFFTFHWETNKLVAKCPKILLVYAHFKLRFSSLMYHTSFCTVKVISDTHFWVGVGALTFTGTAVHYCSVICVPAFPVSAELLRTCVINCIHQFGTIHAWLDSLDEIIIVCHAVLWKLCVLYYIDRVYGYRVSQKYFVTEPRSRLLFRFRVSQYNSITG